MDKFKTVVIPVLLIAVFGLAFYAGVRNLRGGDEGAAKKGSGSGTLAFASSTQEAFVTAAKESKVVMVKYGAEWCPPCKGMKEEAFEDAGVAELLSEVVVVDIDIDAPGSDQEWLDEQKIGPIPTVQMFRADGSLIGEFVGYNDIESFKKDVQKLLDKA